MTGRLARVGGTLVDLAAFPKVTIATAGGAPIVSKVDYLTATISISGPDPYSGSTQIRGRGNSTWQAPKKPYRLKLASAASPLGLPAERDFVLLANYYDAALVRTSIAMEIGRRCTGLPWTPKFRYVELTLNGLYQGLYQLGEHVEISRPNKVNVTAATGTTGLAMTGAYTLEINASLEVDGETGFRTVHDNLPIATDDPDGAIPEQLAYIHNHIDAFETVLYGANWLDPTTGYTRFVDRNSFIDWYLVNELLANQDSGYYKSCKLYKQRDPDANTFGKLFMGPLWDFDLSLSNNMFGQNDLPPTGFWTRPGATWINRMFSDPAFAATVAARWAALRTSLVTASPIATFIDSTTRRIAYAANRDRAVWQQLGDANDTAAAMKTWLATRIAWLDTQFV